MKGNPSVSPLRLIKRRQELLPLKDVDLLPRGMRGIYVLYNHMPNAGRFDVVYVGMAASGSVRRRLKSHRKRKKDLWTHCSVYEVWDNISPAEVKEIEGIFRHIYRKDSRAAELNVQRSFAKMKKLPRLISKHRKATT
jgi:hypothetical protein